MDGLQRATGIFWCLAKARLRDKWNKPVRDQTLDELLGFGFTERFLGSGIFGETRVSC